MMAATAGEDYTIREARLEEQSTLVTLLEEHFFACEYVKVVYFKKNAYQLDELEKKNIAEDNKISYTDMIANHPSLIVIHNESNSIVGISVMVEQKNPKFSKTEGEEKCTIKSTSKRSKLLADFSNFVIRPTVNSFDLFAQFPNHRRALSLRLLCVHSNHYGRNLATRLVQETVKYAENKRIGLVHGIFTSASAQKAAEKNGFKRFSDVDILSFYDEDGNAIFEGEKSHLISVMAKEIQLAETSD